ncbi:MAG: T9SS type A sorting domain-containing protein [Bacteroidales bacterium]
MKQIIIILSFLLAMNCKAQDTIKVLFIGNSYTYVENMPDLFRNIADSAGYKVKTQMYAPGGVSVGDISQGTQAHMNNPAVYENIRSDKWDYVMLQDNQGRFVLDYGHFPSSSLVIQGHLQIRDSVLKNNPCAKMVWFSGWGTKNGMPPYGNTGIEMIERIAANYRFLNDTAHQIIAPIGGAWKKTILSNPAFDLFSPDEMHPSKEGAFLTASVIYATIFKDDPSFSSANGGFPATTANLLKLAAWQTLIDSFPASNLQSNTPELQWQNSQLIAGNYQHYYWYQNMQWISTVSSNTLNVGQSGHYYLMAENVLGCKLKSISKHIIITDIEEHTSNDEVRIYPNPAKNILNIDISTASDIFVYDANGKLIALSESKNGKTSGLDVSHFSKGLYFIKIQTNANIVYRKFIKD